MFLFLIIIFILVFVHPLLAAIALYIPLLVALYFFLIISDLSKFDFALTQTHHKLYYSSSLLYYYILIHIRSLPFSVHQKNNNVLPANISQVFL